MALILENAVDSLLNSDKYRNFLLDSYKKVDKCFNENCIDKLTASGTIDELRIIFGEATQNTSNYIYGNNKNGIRSNSFLTPAIILGKPCGKNTSFEAVELHNKLIEYSVVAVDVFPLPLPSDVYRSGAVDLGDSQEDYLDHKVSELIALINYKSIRSIKAVCRYKESSVSDQATKFVNKLKKADSTIAVAYDSKQDLSNDSGGLDAAKFFSFVEIPYTAKEARSRNTNKDRKNV